MTCTWIPSIAQKWRNFKFQADDDADFPFVNGRCHFEQSLPFPTTVDAICNICTVKRIWTSLNQVVGIVAVYRTRMLAVTGSKHGNSFFYLAFVFFFKFSSFFKNSFWFGLRLGLVSGSGFILVLFPRHWLCFLHENDNRLLFEMATTVTNGNDRLRKGKLRRRPYQF